jgi:hypothetical protein
MGRATLGERIDIAGDQPLQEFPRILALDAQHGAVDQ